MKIEKLFLVGVNLHSFRKGEPGEIKGINMVTSENPRDPEGLKPRPCYHIVYKDGIEDHVPISSVTDKDYKFTIIKEIKEDKTEKSPGYFDVIRVKIDKAINKGEYEIRMYNFELLEDIRNTLIEEGYNIETIRNDVIISWD